MAEQKPNNLCGKCEDHTKVDYILSALSDRLDSLDEALPLITKLAAKVSMLITIISVGSSVVFAGCIYTFTAVASFKEEYSLHKLEVQRQLSLIQEESKNFTRSEISRVNAELCSKINALDVKVTNIEGMVKEYKYQQSIKK